MPLRRAQLRKRAGPNQINSLFVFRPFVRIIDLLPQVRSWHAAGELENTG